MALSLPVVHPAELAPALEQRIETMAAERVIERTWSGDHTVWAPDPAEITNRLGWLTLPERMRSDVALLELFRDSVKAEGYSDAVVLGMGGSSLAPEVMATMLPSRDGLRLHILDSTHPDQVRALTERLPLEDTLFLVSSKSGGTIETLSLFRYFWHETGGNGSQFAAITDPGTSLAQLATEREFRATFANPPDMGGRYSALSYFGLVPAAVGGSDISALLDSAALASDACRDPVAENPAALLGALLGEAALTGRDKLSIALEGGAAPLFPWIEQLVAESSGKRGVGILPVGRPSTVRTVREDEVLVTREREQQADTPFASWDVTPDALGGAFFAWEFATAVACHVLGVNPFDQPDVEAAKQASIAALAGEPGSDTSGEVAELLGGVRPRDYIAILAYLPREQEVERTLLEVADRLGERYGVATNVSFGPRYLHSTGQLHKGGHNIGHFIQVVDNPVHDLEIPGQDYSFGRLIRAHADGDLAALRAAGRRAIRTSLGVLADNI